MSVFLAYVINITSDLEYGFFIHENFNINEMNDDECKAEFRFYENDIYNLIDVLHVSAEFTCCNPQAL